jgi:hypothetical protein
VLQEVLLLLYRICYNAGVATDSMRQTERVEIVGMKSCYNAGVATGSMRQSIKGWRLLT